jgi:hypothetical protein
MTERYKISTAQAHRTGDILGIAIVERLDRIIELLEELRRPVVINDDGRSRS